MIAVFGAGGQLGQEIMALAARRGIAAAGFDRAQCDIADEGAVATALDQTRPRFIINAAAYNAVDAAEQDLAGAEAGNVTGPRLLAQAAATHDVPLLHFSTDYVFDGTSPRSYREDDPVAPLGAYGRSKAAGEEAVRNTAPKHLILRTSWVYGVYGRNFLKTILRLTAERDQLRIVADQHGCPTATADLAQAALHLATLPGPLDWGTYHFSGKGAVSWHGFASRIVAAQAPFTGRQPPVQAITTAEYPTPARRPANSELDNSLFKARFGLEAAPWQERTDETVRMLLAARGEKT